MIRESSLMGSPECVEPDWNGIRSCHSVLQMFSS